MQQIKLLVFYLYNKYYPQFREKKTKEKILFKKKLGFNKEFNSQVKTSVIDWKKLFIDANIKQNDTVFIRTTFSCANTFEEGAVAFVDFLKDYFGKEGNIVVSAYTFDKSPLMYLSENPIFDVKKSRGKLSLFNEIFRTSKGVLRSIHPTHSVCAYGKNAAFIVQDHDINQFCYHDQSPFAKLYKMKAKEIFIGVRPLSLSSHYIEQFFTSPRYLYQELKQPIMCRLKINNEVIYKKFQVMDQFRSFNDNYDVLKGTKAEPNKYSIGEVDIYIQSLDKGLEALKELIKNEVYWYKVSSSMKDIFMKIVVKNIALKMFFNTKNSTLYPVDRK